VTDIQMTPFRCNCGTAATGDAPRGAEFDPSHCPDLVIRVKRTTGFEPATPTLARSSRAIRLPTHSPKLAARLEFTIDHSEPRLTPIVKGACVLWSANREFPYHVHHMNFVPPHGLPRHPGAKDGGRC
jgi:hypothetical protein